MMPENVKLGCNPSPDDPRTLVTTITIPLTPEQWDAARTRMLSEEHIEITGDHGEIEKRIKMFWHIDLTWEYRDNELTVNILKQPAGFEDRVESTIRDWFKGA